jgi:hypothetical protein
MELGLLGATPYNTCVRPRRRLLRHRVDRSRRIAASRCRILLKFCFLSRIPSSFLLPSSCHPWLLKETYPEWEE